jgi:thiamine-monophosphate kinase
LEENDFMPDERSRLAVIKEVFGKLGGSSGNVLLGVEAQDDAAVIRLTEDRYLVIASDFIRGTGFYLFELGYLNHYDLGYYLVVANLSDIAAMGARPVGLTTVIRYNASMTDEQFAQLCHGIRDAALVYDVAVVGGDTGGYASDVLAATAFGISSSNRVLLRSGAKIGDLVCISGTIGLPIAAIAYFKSAKPQGCSLALGLEQQLLQSWKRPSARVKEGILLAERRLSQACQDVSDGLKATVEQMSSLSGVGFTINEADLPIPDVVKDVAAFLSVPVCQLALSASVDFALLFTIPRANKSACETSFSEEGLSCRVIGEINSVGENLLSDAEGKTVPLPGIGWNHQEGDLLAQVLKR